MALTALAEFSMLNSRQNAINPCPWQRNSGRGMPVLSLRETPSDGMETDAALVPTALDEALLAQYLGTLVPDRELVECTTSTNADLLERARLRAPARPVLRVAQRQTEGRGRRGRRWHGNDAGSLLFSLALPWGREPARSAAVTLACGIAAAGAVRAFAGAQPERIRMKWPNDLLLDDAKLAGILVEMADDPAGARTLVVGMGINLWSDEALRARIAGEEPGRGAGAAPVAVADLATLLGRAAVLGRREALLAQLARALLTAAQRFEREGFEGGPAAFEGCCAYRGLAVDVQGAGGPVTTGILRGVDAEGRLLLEHGGVLQAVNSGEISLRRAAGGVS